MASKYRSIVFLAVSLLMVAPVVNGQDQGSDGGQSRAKIRAEYRNTLETPDDIIFGTLLLHTNASAQNDYLSAVQNIQYRMEIDNEEEAKTFLDALLRTQSELEQEQTDITIRMLCGKSGHRSKKQLYTALDLLDDAMQMATKKHFLVLKASLDQPTKDGLTNWLQTMKLSHYHRTAEHESLYEGTDYDVTLHVDMACANLAATS